MFVGNFTEPLSDPGSYTGTLHHGIVCSTDAEEYTDGSLTVLFWGRLYSKDKEDVAATIARRYRTGGVKALGEVDGQFTVVLRENGQTTIVRDHHGAGSQVYYSDTHFASSLALLQQTPGSSTHVNIEALAAFLSVGYISTGQSAFHGITKLPAGHALIVSSAGKRLINLFDTSMFLPAKADGTDLDTLSRQYGKLHAQAVRRRIGDSRNVGMLLSGGYDSGANLAALRNNYSGDIHSFSIGFKGDNWSELPLARCMSQRFGTIHHEYEIDGSEINALPSMVRVLGDPFVEGGLMVNYAAMQMVSGNKPEVVLGGDGSDQYFGTSGREVAMHYLISKWGMKPCVKLFHSLLSSETFEKNGMPYRIRFHLNKILHILQGDLFGFEAFQLNRLFNERPVIEKKSPEVDLRSFEHLYTQHAYQSDLEKVINQVILFKASQMAALFDVPIAFPYMDIDLYRFLQQLPVEYKCRGENVWKIAKGSSTAKFLLKYHYKPMLPVEITSKKKQGGFAPMPIFFADKDRRDRLADYIMHSAVVNELLNRSSVEQFIKTYDREASMPGNWFWYRQNKAIQYFNLLNLAIWWETYVKKNPSVSL